MQCQAIDVDAWDCRAMEARVRSRFSSRKWRVWLKSTGVRTCASRRWKGEVRSNNGAGATMRRPRFLCPLLDEDGRKPLFTKLMPRAGGRRSA